MRLHLRCKRLCCCSAPRADRFSFIFRDFFLPHHNTRSVPHAFAEPKAVTSTRKHTSTQARRTAGASFAHFRFPAAAVARAGKGHNILLRSAAALLPSFCACAKATANAFTICVVRVPTHRNRQNAQSHRSARNRRYGGKCGARAVGLAMHSAQIHARAQPIAVACVCRAVALSSS